MSAKKEVDELAAPTPGELEALAVLFEQAAGGGQSLALSEVHRRICERRAKASEPEPALTTISTHLRNLLDKELIEEMPRAGTPAGPTRGSVRTRGRVTPPTRSPFTSYRARHPPGVVLGATLRELAAAYPESNRFDMLMDLAKALGVSAEALEKLQELIEAERKRAKKGT